MLQTKPKHHNLYNFRVRVFKFHQIVLGFEIQPNLFVLFEMFFFGRKVWLKMIDASVFKLCSLFNGSKQIIWKLF